MANHAPRQLRVAVVQMDPTVERVEDNIKKARKLTDGLKRGTVDLVCFSEMIFTGYVFPSYKALEPHLERPGEGPTFSFCSKLAKRLSCHVVAGYPERLSPLNETIASEVLKAVEEEKTAEIQFAGNSATLIGPDGSVIGNYRKSNLYEADMPWAQAGTGFTSFTLPGLPKLSIGICMDLNPRPDSEWITGRSPKELADYCIEDDIGLLILPCAWLDSEAETNYNIDLHNIDYWCRRLDPLFNEENTGTTRETIVVVVNRTGFEQGETVNVNILFSGF
ncbi:Carbon-nitrogen hydrolase [Tulasnella sp. JGI-2019a]|nr:Carbon-nitrogen hydrolase [Tulasnella sp. JGI-2019a]